MLFASACDPTACGAAARLRQVMRALMLALAMLVAAAVCRAQPVTLTDDAGRLHRLAAPPQRIVSLMPSLTESLFAIGAGARVVGVDRHANWPPEVAALPRLGGLDDALVEPIVRLKPDVVLASSSSRALDRLEALGLPVLRFKSDSHGDVRRSLLLLGQLIGQPEAGAVAWQRIDDTLARAAEQAGMAWRGQSVYVEVGGGPYAAGAASFIGETLARLGLVNIAPAEMGPFPKLNPEFVWRARPDLVIAAQADIRAMAARPGWQALPAIAEQRVCALSPAQYEALVRPGPRLGQAALSLVECLQRLKPARHAPGRHGGRGKGPGVVG